MKFTSEENEFSIFFSFEEKCKKINLLYDIPCEI